MSKTEDRDQLIGQYLEDFIPEGYRGELEHLSTKAVKGTASRRSFLTRAGSLGIGAAASSTILTGLTAKSPQSAAAIQCSPRARAPSQTSIKI
ncbi:MAG TPA: hypothetical protein VGG79_00505 [Roseiarcus sp.]|jgi:hypothetical protein